jgi:hypothetical protein
MMQLSFYLVSWAVLAVAVGVLAVYRASLGRHEDAMLHLSAPEAALIPGQTHMAVRMRKVEIWGKSLTVIAAVYGLTLLAIWAYEMWERGNQVSFH